MQEEDPLVDHPRYQKLKDINHGTYGFVILAKDKSTSEQVAIKFLPRGSRISINVEREILNHKDLLHNHVIQFKGVFLTSKYLAIVMEYAPGGSLLQFIHANGKAPGGGLDETTARWFFQQLILGLDYIHRMGVANRDIKPGNTLLDVSPWPIVKICDFGFSKHETKDSLPHSLVGTKPYLAPEVFFREESEDTPYDGKKADIWSCGAVLYMMISKQHLFDSPGNDRQSHEAQIRVTLDKLDEEPLKGAISTECKDLLRKILVTDPKARPGIREIQQHKWYQTDLPTGVLSFNKRTETQNIQSEKELQELFTDARKALPL